MTVIGFLITAVVVILVAGVLVWGINNFPGIDANFKQAAKVVIIVIVALWVILTLAGYAPMASIPFRR